MPPTPVWIKGMDIYELLAALWNNQIFTRKAKRLQKKYNIPEALNGRIMLELMERHRLTNFLKDILRHFDIDYQKANDDGYFDATTYNKHNNSPNLAQRVVEHVRATGSVIKLK